MDTCWHSCVKYFIVIFNLLLALAGLAIIGVGAYIQIGAKHYLDFLDSTYLNTPIVFIIVGKDLNQYNILTEPFTTGRHRHLPHLVLCVLRFPVREVLHGLCLLRVDDPHPPRSVRIRHRRLRAEGRPG